MWLSLRPHGSHKIIYQYLLIYSTHPETIKIHFLEDPATSFKPIQKNQWMRPGVLANISKAGESWLIFKLSQMKIDKRIRLITSFLLCLDIGSLPWEFQSVESKSHFCWWNFGMDSSTKEASVFGMHRELLSGHIYNSQYLLYRNPKIVIGSWGDPLLSL